MGHSNTPQPRDCILQVDPYLPGRAKTGNAAEVHKLSSNESPFGPSKKVIEAYAKAQNGLGLYPVSGAAPVREALAKKFGIEAERIICGAGVEDLLILVTRVFLQKGDEAIYTEYGFNMYAIDVKASGATSVIAKEKNFTADVDAILKCVSERTKAVFLANPNNPTGTYIPASEIMRLHKNLPADCLFVLDEAYGEYVTSEKPCGLALAKTASNVLLTRTFSKVYGLAGLRLGWAYGARDIIDAMNRVRGIFNISVPAIEAAVAALDDQAHVDKTVAHTVHWRDWLARELTALGLKVTPSEGNFVLVHFLPNTPHDVKAADSYLMSHGYILRRLDPYHLYDAMRLTVGTEEENKAVVKHLREFMQREMAA
jgi:histidinol-phosphate aminotransferase